jgi:hypothetical protein
MLEAKFTESGYGDIATTVVRPNLCFDSAGEALEMMQSAFGAYRAVVADLPEDASNAAWSQVGEFLLQFDSNAGWETELEVVIASGTTST